MNNISDKLNKEICVYVNYIIRTMTIVDISHTIDSHIWFSDKREIIQRIRTALDIKR